jgi:hypothetical protein
VHIGFCICFYFTRCPYLNPLQLLCSAPHLCPENTSLRYLTLYIASSPLLSLQKGSLSAASHIAYLVILSAQHHTSLNMGRFCNGLMTVFRIIQLILSLAALGCGAFSGSQHQSPRPPQYLTIHSHVHHVRYGIGSPKHRDQSEKPQQHHRGPQPRERPQRLRRLRLRCLDLPRHSRHIADTTTPPPRRYPHTSHYLDCRGECRITLLPPKPLTTITGPLVHLRHHLPPDRAARHQKSNPDV